MFHLIDADTCVLEVTAEIIASAGFESLTFDSPVSYLEYAKSASFTPAMAMITCYIMPAMNGFELITEIRKKYPLQKAILISGSSTIDAPDQSEHLVCLHLLKPYKSEDIIAALKTLNLCDTACAKTRGMTFNKSCKFGLNHVCPFYTDK